jgi:hypothetical protein
MTRAAVFLLALGILQMAGDVLRLPALKGIGAATDASPAPKVFSSVRGLETFSTRFEIEWTDTNGGTRVFADPTIGAMSMGRSWRTVRCCKPIHERAPCLIPSPLMLSAETLHFWRNSEFRQRTFQVACRFACRLDLAARRTISRLCCRLHAHEERLDRRAIQRIPVALWFLPSDPLS